MCASRAHSRPQRGADSRFPSATGLVGNRGGDPASQILQEIVLCAWTWTRSVIGGISRGAEASCCFQFSVCVSAGPLSSVVFFFHFLL